MAKLKNYPTNYPIKLMNLIQKHQQTFPLNQGINTLQVWHTFDQLLGLQILSDIQGDILEIGVLEGATIAFLCCSLQNQERAFLLDPYQDIEAVKQVISEFSEVDASRILTYPIDSRIVAKRHSQLLGNYNPFFRFVHIDGEHSYDAVYSDIDLSYKYLANGGLIVLDDIFNIASACCTQAMFDYLKSNPNLQCVAIGFNKAYLCESKYVGIYRKFFLSLPSVLAEEGLHIRLCFNDWAYERGYLTFHSVNEGEPKYQAINKICFSLDEICDYLDVACQ